MEELSIDLYTCLPAKITNKFELNKLTTSNFRRVYMQKLGGLNYVGEQDRASKLYPGSGTSMLQFSVHDGLHNSS